MIELIKVNLLPYREEINRKNKQRFKGMMIAAAVIGIGLAAFAYFTLDQMISRQESRNQFITDETAKLDKKLQTIKDLNAQKEDFLAKKQKVEELQNKRFEGARIVDTLNILLPDSVYLTSIKADSRNPNKYEISGRATNDRYIASFMDSIPSTGLFQHPELLSLKKVDNYQEFKFSTSLVPLSLPTQGKNPSSIEAANGKVASK